MWMTYCEWYSWYYSLLESFMNEVEPIFYQDRPTRLITLSQNTFLELDSEEVQNGTSQERSSCLYY